MSYAEVLKGKNILIVDDEPDVLATLSELLEDCNIDTAIDFSSAQKFFLKKNYDAAILDIMGVDGYSLLKLSKEKGIPALMLTAHALDAENFKKSIRKGAYGYIPKEFMADIEHYLAALLRANEKQGKKSGAWFARLKPYFSIKFGRKWQEQDKDFWNDFDRQFTTSKEELEAIL